MKSEDPFHEIAGLLRSNTPDPVCSPGLEKKILRALAEKRRQPTAAVWRWLALPAAAAGVALLAWPRAPRPGSPVAVENPPAETPVETPAISEMAAANPLNSESLALARDAERAGVFLIDCLPAMKLEP